MANLGYIQVIRRCQHSCVFCSNPRSSLVHDTDSVRALIDDLVDREYQGAILTGGEPTLYPNLCEIIAYAHQRGLQVRMITNGSRGADDGYYSELVRAGLTLVHVSIYSCRPEVEESLRGIGGTLDLSHAAIASMHRVGVAVNVNTVINRHNADHLDETVQVLIQRHPYIRHFVWNNIDPSMGRAHSGNEQHTARLADMELSLLRAARFLRRRRISFRVERVPLCYMTEFAWASTETRKIVKSEERVVHFLDEKGTVRQTDFRHAQYEPCTSCSLRSICAGLFEPGNGYDPAELHPVFVDVQAIIKAVLNEPNG